MQHARLAMMLLCCAGRPARSSVPKMWVHTQVEGPEARGHVRPGATLQRGNSSPLTSSCPAMGFEELLSGVVLDQVWQ